MNHRQNLVAIILRDEQVLHKIPCSGIIQGVDFTTLYEDANYVYPVAQIPNIYTIIYEEKAEKILCSTPTP